MKAAILGTAKGIFVVDAVSGVSAGGREGGAGGVPSRGEADFANKVLSAMRFQFGGHRERPTGG